MLSRQRQPRFRFRHQTRSIGYDHHCEVLPKIIWSSDV